MAERRERRLLEFISLTSFGIVLPDDKFHTICFLSPVNKFSQPAECPINYLVRRGRCQIHIHASMSISISLRCSTEVLARTLKDDFHTVTLQKWTYWTPPKWFKPNGSKIFLVYKLQPVLAFLAMSMNCCKFWGNIVHGKVPSSNSLIYIDKIYI